MNFAPLVLVLDGADELVQEVMKPQLIREEYLKHKHHRTYTKYRIRGVTSLDSKTRSQKLGLYRIRQKLGRANLRHRKGSKAHNCRSICSFH